MMIDTQAKHYERIGAPKFRLAPNKTKEVVHALPEIRIQFGRTLHAAGA